MQQWAIFDEKNNMFQECCCGLNNKYIWFNLTFSTKEMAEAYLEKDVFGEMKGCLTIKPIIIQ